MLSLRLSVLRMSRLLLVLLAMAVAPGAQQVRDTAFRPPPIEKPAYRPGKGPVVLIDEGHFNASTATERYLPLAELLRQDGYVVKSSPGRFTAGVLHGTKVLVIALFGSTVRAALASLNGKKENEKTTPQFSAFTPEEVAVVRDWVKKKGRSLLLIVDHEPASAVVDELAKAFGVRFLNGIAYKDRSGRLIFRRADGTLLDHQITQGINEVATFAGSSFQLDTPGQPLLVFGPEVTAWRASDSSEVSVKGHLQGAVLTFGKGRVAVFGEAGMFAAQLSGPNKSPMGMNAAIAKQNPQFLVNVMHWLTRAKVR